MQLRYNKALEPIWDPLVETLAAMITLSGEYVVLQVTTPHHGDCGPYVQTLQEEDGALTLEAVSNEFVDPPLGPDSVNTLRDMGWTAPDGEEGFPNFRIFLEADEVEPGHVARFLVATLRDAYLVTPKDSFELAPMELFVQVVEGEFGNRPGLTFTPIDLDEVKAKYLRRPK